MRDGGLAWGATNSGKTYRIARHFVRRCALNARKQLLIGANLKLLRGEVIPLIQHHARTYRVPCSKYHVQMGQMNVGRSLVIVIAGNKDGDEDRLRTYHGIDSVMAEEVTAMPEDFFDMALTRQSPHPDTGTLGPVWASCNPSIPTNWVKTRLDNGRWPHDEMFLVKDNPTLTPEQVQAFEEQFTGVFAQRMIEALWAAPEGLIYPTWERATVEEAEALRGQPCWLGGDYGFSSVTAAVYFQKDASGRFIVTDEYYYDAHAMAAKRDPTEHAMHIVNRAPGPILRGYIDPSALDLKDALHDKGVVVVNGHNKADGYGVTDGALQKERIVICTEKAPALTREIQSLVYNRIGTGPDSNCIDHATDSLRYGACGISEHWSAVYGGTRYAN